MAEQKSFKERVKEEAIVNAKMFKEFFVDSSSQGKGTGKKLLNALENILMEKEVGVVHFWTMKGSTAEAFYNKRGYEIPKELIMMRKKLK